MSHLFRSSLIIAVFFGMDKAMGFVRQVLFNRAFLAAERDVFFVSNNIPDLLSALISGGALGIALIPVLAEYLERQGRPAAWQLFTRVANLAFIITGVISLIIIASADWLVQHVIAPGFTAEQWRLTANLMRMDLAAILIFSISGLVMAGLQANQHFLLPAMAPAFYNLGQISGILILAPRFGIYGMVYGVILGAALHLLIQLPGLLRFGYRWAPSLGREVLLALFAVLLPFIFVPLFIIGWLHLGRAGLRERIEGFIRDAGVFKVLALMGPRLLNMLCLQGYFLTRDRFASFFEVGAVSALNNGWFIQQVPETLIGTAIAIALLPSLSELAVRGDDGRFRQTVNNALRAMLAFTLPIAAILSVAIRPLVQLVFNFDPAETELVVWATRLFLLGLLGHTWLEVAVRSFYARQNALLPLLAAFLQLIVYLLLAMALTRWLGSSGLALADTLAFSGQALLLLGILHRQMGGILSVTGTLLRGVLGGVLAALLVYAVLNWLPLPAIPALLLGLVAGGLAALSFAWPEVKMVVKL
jgi:putative peptidoglycan lipid II flippase